MLDDGIKFSLQGHFGADTFSFGFWVQCATPLASSDVLSTIVDAMNTSMNSDESPSAWTNLSSCISSDCSWDFINAYFYGNGAQPAEFVVNKSVNHAGSGGSNDMLQKALVVTLLTGQSGRRHRGRCYLPMFGQPTSAGHIASSGTVNLAALAALDTFSAALTAVRAHGGGDGSRVVVYSGKSNAARVMTSVSIDNRFDVIRARANKQGGSRLTFPFTIP